MSRFAAVDLASLPLPNVIETISFETIFAALKSDFIARCTAAGVDYSAINLESDPVVKLFEAAAYREMIVRQRVNDAARARNLAFATASDLDALAVDAGVYRLTITPATSTTEAVMESDDDLRRRVQLAPEALNTAGCAGAYVFNALTAGAAPVLISVSSPDANTVTLTYQFDGTYTTVSALVKDATAIRPVAGSVLVTVLGRNGQGVVDTATLDLIAANLSAGSTRPLCDEVTVQSATIRTYSVTAALEVYEGIDLDAIRTAAIANLTAVTKARHALGESVTDSVIKAALHVSGVKTVHLTGWADIVCDETQAPYMTASTITSYIEGQA